MRRHNPDALTAREREVLALIRIGLTNEEIASRLGISLDGAKYHVSQILSKLGVATREEAAEAALEERRRWWARWPVWAKIAGAATVVATVGALVVLAWGVVRTDSKGEEHTTSSIDPDVKALYDDIREAMNRTGSILHTSTEGLLLGADHPPNEWVELWIDGSSNVARRILKNVPPPLGTRADGLIGIYGEKEWFSLMDGGRLERFEVDASLLWIERRDSCAVAGVLSPSERLYRSQPRGNYTTIHREARNRISGHGAAGS